MPINEYDAILTKGEIPSAGNEYLDLVGDQKSIQRQQLQSSFYKSKDKTSDYSADVLKLSKKLNLPSDFIDRNYDEIKKQSESKTDYDKLINNSPATAKYLSNQYNAATSKDDIEAISKMETGVRLIRNRNPIARTGSEVTQAAMTGWNDLNASTWHLAMAYGLTDIDTAANNISESNRRSQELRSRVPDYAQEFNSVMAQKGQDVDQAFNLFSEGYEAQKQGRIKQALKDYGAGTIVTIGETLDMVGSALVRPRGLAYSTLQNLAYSLPSLITGFAGAKTGAKIGVAGAAIAGQLGPQVTTPEEVVTVPVAATIGGVGGFVVGSFAGQVPVEVGAWINQELQGKGYDLTDPEQIKEAYSDPELLADIKAEAQRKGITTAAVDSIFNLFAGKLVAGGTGTKLSTALRTGGDIAVQSVGEASSEFAGQVAAKKGMKGTSLGEAVQEGITSFGHSFGETAIGASTRGVDIKGKGKEITQETIKKARELFSKNTVKAAQEVAQETGKAVKAQQDTQALSDIGEAVKESKTAQRNPEAIKEIIDIATQGDDNSNVYFQTQDWDDYWTSKGESPSEKAAEIMGDGGKSYFEAKNNGDNFILPLADYVSKLASTDDFNGLLSSARTDVEGMSLQEAKDFLTELPDVMDTLAEEATQQDQEIQDTSEQVATNITEQLVSAGFEQNTAETYGQLYKSTFSTLAQRTGLSVDELFGRFNLKIERKEKFIEEKEINLKEIQKKRRDELIDEIEASSPIIQFRKSVGKQSVFIPEENWNDWKPVIDKIGKQYFTKNMSNGSGIPIDTFAQEFGSKLYGSELSEKELFDLLDNVENINQDSIKKEIENRISEEDEYVQYLRSEEIKGLFENITIDQINELLNSKKELRNHVKIINDFEPELKLTEEEVINELNKLRQIINQIDQTSQREDKFFQTAPAVDTPEFKKWFRQSKVVEKGKPISVFHGSDAFIDEFKFEFTNKGFDALGSGFYFTTDKEEAAQYAGADSPNIVETYLSIQKPLKSDSTKKLTRDQIKGIILNSPTLEDSLSNFGDVEFEGRDKVLNEAIDSYYDFQDKTLGTLFALANDFFDTDIESFNKAVTDHTGYDGVVSEFDNGRKHYVAFFPTQVKSVDNQGTFDIEDPRIFFQQDYRDLFVQHNLNAENIRVVDELGGLAAPSLAISRTTTGALEGFGDITLIADKSILGSEKAKTFDADIYSPRFPTIKRDLDIKSFYKFRDELEKDIEGTGDLSLPDMDALENDDLIQFGNNNAMRYAYLKSIGKAPQPKMMKLEPEYKKALKITNSTSEYQIKKLEEVIKLATKYYKNRSNKIKKKFGKDFTDRYFNKDGSLNSNLLRDFSLKVASYNSQKGIDTHDLSLKIDKSFKNKKVQKGYEIYVMDIASSVAKKKKVFKGFSSSGNKKLSDYNLANVVKEMTRTLQNGESFFYGAGNIRAAYSKQLKSIKDIKENRERIISIEDAEKFKEESNEKVSHALEALKKYYKNDNNSFRYYNIAAEVIADSPSEWSEYFEINDQSKKIITELIEYLRGLPTEYFETKIQRAVFLNEFEVAVIPKDTPKDVVEILKRKGLKIKRYNSNIKGDRNRVIENLNDKYFFQRKSDPKGVFRFGNNKFNINLFKNADLSTFLHESGHFYLEMLGDLLESGLSNNDQIKSDYETILKWLGVESRGQIKTEHHEKFARGFEAYLMEGKAPSLTLRDAFAKFRAWLTAIYRSIRNLNVPLNKDIRGVFDRLLATDEEIQAAQEEGNITQIFITAEQAGMTDEEFKLYEDTVRNASQKAQDRLQQKILKQYRREQEKWWKDRRDEVQQQVTDEINNDKNYIALSILQKGTLPDGSLLPEGMEAIKISKKALTDTYDKSIFKKLPKPFIYTQKDEGVHQDVAAEMLGFSSGDELINALSELQTRKQAIQTMTDARMKEQYGDKLLDGTLAEDARLAVNNDERSKVILAELKALRKRQKEVKPFLNAQKDVQREGVKTIKRAVPTIDVVRRIAKNTIAGKKVRNVIPYNHFVAARKASKKAFDSLAKRNYEEAATFKQQELLSMELYREASRVRDEVDKTINYMKRFAKKSTRENLAKAGIEYLDQIDALLDRFDFAKGISLKRIDKRKSLLAWVESQREQGLEPDIPEKLMDEAYKMHYKDLTIDELMGLKDSVKNIENYAIMKNKLLKAAKQRAFDEVIDEAVASIEANSKGKRKTDLETRLPKDEWKRLVEGYTASHRKFASLIRQMDGFEEGGALWEILTRPMNEAGDQEAVMNEAATEKLKDIFSVYSTKELTQLYKKQYIADINDSLTKMGQLSVALNWGNADSRQKVMDGRKWTKGQVDAILDRLDERDWKFVQSVWDFLDSYWAETKALAERVNGVAPEKVQSEPVQTKFGEFPGGYYPLKYDDRLSDRAFENSAKEATDRAMRGAFIRSTTKQGHRKNRVEGVKMPVRLDFGVLFEHVTEIIHDQTHYEFLIDTNKILKNERMKTAIKENYGDIVYREMTKAIDDVAAGMVPAQNSFEKAVNWLRSGTSIAAMGWNLMTSLQQPLGLTQSMVRIGPKWVAKGVRQWIGSPQKMQSTIDNIYEKSSMMRLRGKTQMREINEIRNKLRLKGNLSAIEDSYFYLIAKGQMIADIPTWLGAYEKAWASDIEMTEEKAARLADQAVLDSQGGGQVKDLADIQRGSPLKKLWTNFYSYFNTTYNLTAESFRKNDIKSATGIGALAVDLLMLYSLPSILGVLIKDAIKGGDDEPLPEKLVREQAGYLLGTMVGVRELSGVVQGFYGYDGPEGTRFFGEFGGLIRQIEQGEADTAFWKSLNKSAGILFHYPAGQIERTFKGVNALAEGETNNPLVFLTGPKKN